MTDKDLKQRYKYYNREYFGNKLPDIIVRFSSKRKHDRLPKGLLGGSIWRRTSARKGEYYKILITRTTGRVVTYQTLLHEMIHVKIGYKYHHGPVFQREITRLFKKGAYKNLL